MFPQIFQPKLFVDIIAISWLGKPLYSAEDAHYAGSTLWMSPKVKYPVLPLSLLTVLAGWGWRHAVLYALIAAGAKERSQPLNSQMIAWICWIYDEVHLSPPHVLRLQANPFSNLEAHI